MGSTLVQKILARASRRSHVDEGEIIWAVPDLVTMPEVSFPAYVKRLRDIGIAKFARPERIAVVIDHEVPVHSQAGAERNRLTRQLAQQAGVGYLFDGEGITHPLVVERGLVAPGDFVIGADTHTPGIGGVGALAMPFGMEVTMTMARGDIWLRVPETIRVRVDGRLRPGVTARDIVLATMRLIDADMANYRVAEFIGECIAGLSIPERMTICGLCVDAGLDAGIVPADAMCADVLRSFGIADAHPMAGDHDAKPAFELSIDASTLEPQVSAPPSPTNVHAISELRDIRIDHAYIGSCASGSLGELHAAAKVLEGRRVHPGVQLLVIPATRRIYQAAMNDGTIARLMQAGAQIAPSTCGPCFGGLAQLDAGEVRISTSTRNDPGRMGHREASIYLASAMTVAASAAAGRIADARDFLAGSK